MRREIPAFSVSGLEFLAAGLGGRIAVSWLARFAAAKVLPVIHTVTHKILLFAA